MHKTESLPPWLACQGETNGGQDESVKYTAHVMVTARPRKEGRGGRQADRVDPAEMVATKPRPEEGEHHMALWGERAAVRQRVRRPCGRYVLGLKGLEASQQVELNKEEPYGTMSTHYFSKDKALRDLFCLKLLKWKQTANIRIMLNTHSKSINCQFYLLNVQVVCCLKSFHLFQNFGSVGNCQTRQWANLQKTICLGYDHGLSNCLPLDLMCDQRWKKNLEPRNQLVTSWDTPPQTASSPPSRLLTAGAGGRGGGSIVCALLGPNFGPDLRNSQTWHHTLRKAPSKTRVFPSQPQGAAQHTTKNRPSRYLLEWIRHQVHSENLD